MQVVRAINNNAAICEDGSGRELIALGRGIGFGRIPREVALSEVDRTFYGIDPKYLRLIDELPPESLEFAGQLADVCRAALSYELSPNLPVTLADHIAFMVERARRHQMVRMPLAYDVQQVHPAEYRLGEMAVNGASRTFGVRLPKSEAVGVALSIVNSAITPSERTAQREHETAELVDRITKLVERDLAISVDRESFDFARFATHVRYLIDRVRAGEPIASRNSDLYDEVAAMSPQVAECARRAGSLVATRLGNSLTKEELLYLMLHMNRIVDRVAGR